MRTVRVRTRGSFLENVSLEALDGLGKPKAL